jgi:hypothetical protein
VSLCVFSVASSWENDGVILGKLSRFKSWQRKLLDCLNLNPEVNDEGSFN